MVLSVVLVVAFSVQSCLFNLFGKKFYSSVVEMDVIMQMLVTYSAVLCYTHIREMSTAPGDLCVNSVNNDLGNV